MKRARQIISETTVFRLFRSRVDLVLANMGRLPVMESEVAAVVEDFLQLHSSEYAATHIEIIRNLSEV